MGHTLSRQERAPYAGDGFICNLCREKGCGPLYHCSDCDYDVHVQCAATNTQQTHFTHPHHALLLARCSPHARVCDSCGTKIQIWSFRCESCDFDIHPTCVRALRCILHPQHPHPLTLLQQLPELPSHERCSGCLMPVTKWIYQCGICEFNLHQVCATLPSKVKHLKHQAHALMMLDRPATQEGGAILCGECGGQVQGWHFSCAHCKFNLHPICANLVHDFLHDTVESPACESNNQVVPLAIWAPRNVHDVSGESSDAEGSLPLSGPCAMVSKNLLTSEAMVSLPTSLLSNVSHRETSTTIALAATSIVENLSQNSTSLLLNRPLQIPYPSKEDWEAVQRVLQFAQEMAKVPQLDVTPSSAQGHPDEGLCPTCHKGYDRWNPKRSTSCGHHFHLACILDGQKRSNLCPTCGKDFKF